MLPDCYFTLKAWNAQNGGAAAILVAGNKVEPLITMDTPEEYNAVAEYVENITIPSTLIRKSLGDRIKKALFSGEMVNLNLDWTEPLPHPDERVEYEFGQLAMVNAGQSVTTRLMTLSRILKEQLRYWSRKGTLMACLEVKK